MGYIVKFYNKDGWFSKMETYDCQITVKFTRNTYGTGKHELDINDKCFQVEGNVTILNSDGVLLEHIIVLPGR